MKALLLCAMLSMSCSKTQPVATAPTPASERARIVERDLAWIHDSIVVVRYNAPFVYMLWRLEVEQCSGLAREGWPRFYVAPVNPLPGNRGGFYAPSSESIVFALGYESDRMAVRHEILHFVAHPTIPPKPAGETPEEAQARMHPPALFGPQGKCGSLVSPA